MSETEEFDETTVELPTEEEVDDNDSLDLPSNSFTPVNFSSGNRRIIDLYRSYSTDKDLDPRPSFQRGYVWDRNRATKLVESILLHVPIPLIYTAEDDDGKEVVIDGQQRLTSCFSFIEGFFPPSRSDLEKSKAGHSVKRRPFKLGKMKILKDLENKSYAELSDDVRKAFDKYNLLIIKISKDSHPDVKFEIFERLNTGSVSLSEQEIRNCIYRGPYNDLLCELANSDIFRKLLGLSGEAARMQDVELVLRFMAFNEKTHLNYDKKMLAFLNSHMRDRRNIEKSLADKYKADFMNACEIAYTIFGEKAFRRYSAGNSTNMNGNWERSVNKAVFDCIMFWAARLEKRQVIEVKDRIREKFIEVCLDNFDFNDAITAGTGDIPRVKTRFEIWGDAIKSIVTGPSNEKRLFSYQEKQKLFEFDPTCSLCDQRIETLDDAAVDHVVPFSKGGATDASNGKIAHRYCNRQKGAKIEPAATT